MSALFTALLEGETKESLAGMVVELRAKLAAYQQLDAAQCAQLSHYAKESRIDNAARATLDSEREANALLTERLADLECILAVGPVMPEHPSEAVIEAMRYAWHRGAEGNYNRYYSVAREALLKEQDGE